MKEPAQEELIEKARSLVGKWIYDKTSPNEYLYAYDYCNYDSMGDTVLECIAVCDPDNGYDPYVTEKDVWMSEFKEFYRMVKGNKGIRTWERIKEHYDNKFKGEKNGE